MHIFTGIATAAPGKDRELIELMTKSRDAAFAAHGVRVSAWSVVAGAPWGTAAISSRVDGIAQLMEMSAKLGADEGWNALATDAASIFVGPADLEFHKVIAATENELGTHQVMSINRVTAARGQLAAAIDHATSMLAFVHDVTGIDGVLTLSEAGAASRLQFVFGVADGAAADAARETLSNHPDYLSRLDEAGRLLEPGASDRMLLVRLP